MSCVVFKSSNKVSQKVNAFPLSNYPAKLQVIRNPNSTTGGTFTFQTAVALTFHASGGAIKFPSGELRRGGMVLQALGLYSAEFYEFILDDTVATGYLLWMEQDYSLGGLQIGSGAIPNYSVGFASNKPKNIARIFKQSPKFNQDVSLCDTSEVIDAAYAFQECSMFNQSINWDFSKMESLKGFFYFASSFNQKLIINAPECVDVSELLIGATAFNSQIVLNAPKCTSAGIFLKNAKSFNQPVNGIYLPLVKEFKYFFEGCESFNQSVDTLLNNKPDNLEGLFAEASSFNQPLNFDASEVVSFNAMLFGASNFNQPLGHLNISKALDFRLILNGAHAFNQDISDWCAKFNINAEIADVSNAPSWSTSNYDKYLNAMWQDVGIKRKNEWSSRSVVKLINAQVKRSSASKDAVDNLISLGWEIRDDGLVGE